MKDGSYDSSKKRPLIALTFDDGPGQYTDKLLDCLEENNAHATFFMLGQNVENYQDEVKRMLEIGCELGNHSWDHLNMFELSIDNVVSNFGKDRSGNPGCMWAGSYRSSCALRKLQ